MVEVFHSVDGEPSLIPTIDRETEMGDLLVY